MEVTVSIAQNNSTKMYQTKYHKYLEDRMSDYNVVDTVFVVHSCVHRNLKPVENEGAQTKNWKQIVNLRMSNV